VIRDAFPGLGVLQGQFNHLDEILVENLRRQGGKKLADVGVQPALLAVGGAEPEVTLLALKEPFLEIAVHLQ